MVISTPNWKKNKLTAIIKYQYTLLNFENLMHLESLNTVCGSGRYRSITALLISLFDLDHSSVNLLNKLNSVETANEESQKSNIKVVTHAKKVKQNKKNRMISLEIRSN